MLRLTWCGFRLFCCLFGFAFGLIVWFAFGLCGWCYTFGFLMFTFADFSCPSCLVALIMVSWLCFLWLGLGNFAGFGLMRLRGFIGFGIAVSLV